MYGNHNKLCAVLSKAVMIKTIDSGCLTFRRKKGELRKKQKAMFIGFCTWSDECTNLGCEAICQKVVSLMSVTSRQKWWRPNMIRSWTDLILHKASRSGTWKLIKLS